MHHFKQCSKWPLFSLLLMLSMGYSIKSFALACRGESGSVRQVIILDKPINVSTANKAAGTLLWRSPSYTSEFTCQDDRRHPEGENAYLYWDPANAMGRIHNSIEVGVTYQSIDIKPVKGARSDVGPATRCVRSYYGCRTPAEPLTVTVTYSVYIKATGNPPPAGGKINDNGTYSLFQVDGVLGLNSIRDSNFNAYITGLGNIRFISCNPKITIAGNNGSTVEFGHISRLNAVAGKIEKQVPFSILTSLVDKDSGQDCQGETLEASFSTTYPVRDRSVILPTDKSGFGIVLSQAETPGKAIQMNTPVPLGVINGDVVQRDFFASLKWLNTSPQIGPFSASANVDVTFK